MPVDLWEVEAVRGVSLTLKNGQIALVIGQNGDGKTTLLPPPIGLCPTRPDDVRGEDCQARCPGAVEHGFCWCRNASCSANSRSPTFVLGAYRGGRTELRERARWTKSTAAFRPCRTEHAKAPIRCRAGERRCCALGRPMMSAPRLMMLDDQPRLAR